MEIKYIGKDAEGYYIFHVLTQLSKSIRKTVLRIHPDQLKGDVQ